MSLDTPVAFIIFKRPDVTAAVFQRIAAARPKRLLVIADGPRRPEEAAACQQTRAIIDKVDWPCDVATNYADANMGLRRRISSGLSWVFEQVEDAIIMEDDCLCDPSFFPYCEELLARYREEPRVMMISGNYFHGNRRLTDDSYYFSRYTHIWGWATWRRAWAHYDPMLTTWPEYRDRPDWPDDTVSDIERGYWRHTFDRAHAGEIDAWSYGWQYALWEQKAYSILPAVNLISNVGFGEGATHTRTVTDLANVARGQMPFPLRHPTEVRRLDAADSLTYARVFGPKPPGFMQRVRGKLGRIYRGVAGGSGPHA